MTAPKLILFAFLSLLAACGSGGGSADMAASSDMKSACPGVSGDGCGTCLAAQCCDDAAACLADPDCAACVKGEDTTTCETSEETHARVNAYLVCRGGACHDDCIGPSGASCNGVSEGLVSTACQACVESACCTELAACHDSEGCWGSCFTNFSEAGCHGNPDGHAVFHALSACVSASCSAECA